MNHNPNECDIVQDLLPLYYDHACSPASCELVRQHLADCADCEKIYEDLANHTIDNVIETESREILERHAKKNGTWHTKPVWSLPPCCLFRSLLPLLYPWPAAADSAYSLS